MLNVEFKVNGNPIGFMNIHNVMPIENGVYLYNYELVTTSINKKFEGIAHNYKDGATVLVQKCLEHAHDSTRT